MREHWAGIYIAGFSATYELTDAVPMAVAAAGAFRCIRLLHGVFWGVASPAYLFDQWWEARIGLLCTM